MGQPVKGQPKGQPPKGQPVKVDKVEAFHNFLMKEFESLTSVSPLAMEAQQKNWKAISLKSAKVLFMAQGPGAEFAFTARGAHPTPCYPLQAGSSSDTACLWWAWREEWTTVDSGVLALVGAGFVFFWGVPSKRAQVFRAEWDDATQRGEARGQPHWHLDDKILAEASWVSSIPRLVSSSDVVEEEFEAIEAAVGADPLDYTAIEGAETQQDLSVINVSGMHLYMGGWTHGKIAPKFWQPTLDLNGLKDWAVRTLHYVQLEAGEIREEL